VGVEILNFTERKLNLNDLVQMNSEELIPRLTLDLSTRAG